MVVITLLVKFIILLRFPPNKSVADQTRGRYGDDILSAFRTWERLSIKYGKIQLDLGFLKTCRDADLVPKFLQFKLSNGDYEIQVMSPDSDADCLLRRSIVRNVGLLSCWIK